ncbi:MAG: hypothetical protein AAF449_16120, partial [Myxococcota bacterium]
LEGLEAVPNEPVDYDNKQVAQAECAVCHSTLDPLTYPFTRYEGLGGGTGGVRGPARYTPDRLDFFEAIDGASVSSTPEAGVIFGQPVQDLVQWARVAANSEAFSLAVTKDYWRLLTGETPRASELEDYSTLARDLMTTHNYSVADMLRQLIFTEAYSVP